MTDQRDVRRVIRVLTVLVVILGAMGSCSRNEPPPPPQAGPPGTVMPQVAPIQPVAPAPGPALGAYAHVHLGMSSQQVLRLLGNPTKVKPKGQYVEWEYWTDGTKFEIKLQADQVVAIERH